MLNATLIANCPNSPAAFPSNSDVTGIGVRVAFYVSLLLGWFRARLFPLDIEDYRASSRLQLVTSTSLIVASLYALYHPNIGLSLLDAQIITLFVGTISACNYSLLYYDIGFTTKVAAQMHLFLSASFGILVYSNPSNFGGASHLPDCVENSDYTYILFGQMSATNKGLQVVSLLICCGALSEFLWRGRGRFFIAVLRVVVWFSDMPFGSALMRIMKEVSGGTLGGRRRPLVKQATTTWIGIGMIIYLIATVESIIQTNNLKAIAGIDTWTFGQTVSLVMVADQVGKTITKVVQKARGEDELANFRREMRAGPRPRAPMRADVGVGKGAEGEGESIELPEIGGGGGVGGDGMRAKD